MQTLKELSKSTPVQNKFELARDEALEILTQLLEMLLVPPQDMPLHELLLFDNLDMAKKELMGNSRLALNDALANPHKYLQVYLLMKALFYITLLYLFLNFSASVVYKTTKRASFALSQMFASLTTCIWST